MAGIDLRDMMLKAAADVQKAVMQFEMDVQKPAVRTDMAKLWMNLPDDMKEKFKAEQPEAYAALIKEIQGGS
jgi:ppGpp synthetase/RelA/SpoT-type nucleotidyltranferase